MADPYLIMADILVRGLRKIKSFKKPLPIHLIFPHVGNSRFRKKLVDERGWQRELLNHLVEYGAITSEKRNGELSYGMGDVALMAEVLNEYSNPTPRKVSELLGLKPPKKTEISGSTLDARPVELNPNWRKGLPNLFYQVEDHYVGSDAEPSEEEEDIMRELTVAHVEPTPKTDVTLPVIAGAEKPDINPVPVGVNLVEIGITDSLPSKGDPVPDSVNTAQSSPPSTKSVPLKPLASEFPYLNPTERGRVQLIEDVLLRLTYDESYRRTELFPGEYSNWVIRWQRICLNALSDAGILERSGETRTTRYKGIKSKVHELLDDPEWLLRLIVPGAQNRIAEEEPSTEELSEEFHEEFASTDDETDAPPPNMEAPKAEATEASVGAERFFEILEWQHSRISSLEENLKSVNVKLGEILVILRSK